PFLRPHRGAIDDDALQVEDALLAQQVEQPQVGGAPDAGGRPVAEAPPAGGAGGAVQGLAGDGLPLAALAQQVQDAAQGGLVVAPGRPPLGLYRGRAGRCGSIAPHSSSVRSGVRSLATAASPWGPPSVLGGACPPARRL